MKKYELLRESGFETDRISLRVRKMIDPSTPSFFMPLPIKWIVDISFQHANPVAGNESFLLRFDTDEDESICVLVDAGSGVDIDSLLEPADRLAAICLTHAHLDHYAEISAAHRDDVPILTSPATASILSNVFDVAGTEYNVRSTEAVTDAITPVKDWTIVSPDIDVHPVPAGHHPF